MKIISIFSDPIFCIYECLCPIPTRGCGGEGGVEQRRNRLDIRGYRIDMTSPRRKRGHFYKNRNCCLNSSIMTRMNTKRNNIPQTIISLCCQLMKRENKAVGVLIRMIRNEKYFNIFISNILSF